MTCKDCIHYNICCLWSTVDLDKDETYKYCFGNFKATADVVPKSEWISVNERLPERNGRYLTHCDIEGQSLVCILHYSKVGGFNEGTVTYWMPLPEAPKAKGDAK